MSNSSPLAVSKTQVNETFYSKLVNSLGAIVWEADGETFQFTFVSPQAEQVLGYTTAQWLEPNFWLQHTHPDDKDWCSAFCLDATAHHQDHDFEYRMIAADGRIVWLHDIVSVEVEADGSVRLRGMMLDITDRKQAEDDLKKQKEILQKIFDHIPVMISLYDADGGIEMVNREWERVLGWSLTELKEQNLDIMAEIYPDPTDHRRVLDFIARAKGEWRNFKSKVRDRHDIHTTWAVVRLSDQKTIRIGKDITEQKRAEDERSRLLSRLMTAQEDERRHISRELHDNIGQYLSALLLGLESLTRVPDLPVAATSQLSYLKDATKQFEDDVHNFTLELRPTALDDLGLKAALSGFVRERARRYEQKIRIDFNSSGFADEKQRLYPEGEVALYRVVQEALTNVLKHSNATTVSVILERRDDSARVIIEDDGVGFDLEAVMGSSVEKQRLGLRSMRERVEMLRGEFKIESGSGTTIVATIPLSEF